MGSEKDNNKSGQITKFALAAALTAAAGYVAGILTAPKSGKETRTDIKNKATETYAAAEKQLKKLHTELADLLAEVNDKLATLRGKGGDSLEDAIAKGKKAKEKAREALSALHDGDAEDEDLKKAIAEATKAVENLRNYLKK